jgi:hypothetical protein
MPKRQCDPRHTPRQGSPASSYPTLILPRLAGRAPPASRGPGRPLRRSASSLRRPAPSFQRLRRHGQDQQLQHRVRPQRCATNDRTRPLAPRHRRDSDSRCSQHDRPRLHVGVPRPDSSTTPAVTTGGPPTSHIRHPSRPSQRADFADLQPPDRATLERHPKLREYVGVGEQLAGATGMIKSAAGASSTWSPRRTGAPTSRRGLRG